MEEEYQKTLAHFHGAHHLDMPALGAPLPATVASWPFRESLDWSSPQNNPLGRSVVTSVKDQLQCGACWAFVATESVESAVAMRTGILESLSVQELIDCDKAWDKGCVGGNPVLAFPYIMRSGLAPESTYVYRGAEGPCRDRSVPSVSGIRGFRVLRPNDEAAMEYWVRQSPLAVGVAGTAKSLLLYTGGIYDDETCGDELDHALLVVGFGTTRQGAAPPACDRPWPVLAPAVAFVVVVVWP
jgi:hypothetical protein